MKGRPSPRLDQGEIYRMRRLGSAVRILILTSLSLGALSCGASIQSRQTSSSQSAEDAPVVDSGKRLAGDFISISLEDSYHHEAQPQIGFSFDNEGNFKRQDASLIEEGVYVITPNRELVLYGEKVNGEQRQAARVEQYQISDERDEGFTLQEGPSRKTIFRRR